MRYFYAILLSLAFLIIGLLGAIWHPIFLIIGILVFVIFIVISVSMRRTLKGMDLYQKLLGFKLYLKTAEEHRSQFQEREGDLTKLLPYAILFGLTKQWLKAVKSVYSEKELARLAPFFVGSNLSFNDFDAVASAIGQVVNSVSSSSASYSSGGGAGGGGGGGW